MSKVHIALVGGQPMPIHVGIEEFKAEKVILVHSKESKKLAEDIKENVGLPCELQLFDSVDYPKIYEAADKLLGDLEQVEVVINISGGTKPWTVAFILLAQQHRNTSVIYVDQNNVGYNFSTKESKMIERDLDIQTILRFNNYAIGSHTRFNSFTEEDLKAIRLVERIRKKNISEFNLLTIDNREMENINQGKKKTLKGSYVEWDKKAKNVNIVLKTHYGEQSQKCSSPHIMSIAFNSGWFEIQVAEMLSHWEHAKEIILNAKFNYANNTPKNEIDIIVNMGNKLMFVECKTQIKQLTDLDKFTTAAKKYSGMGVKMLFVTKDKMNPKAEEKCLENRIIPFSIQNDGHIVPEAALFSLLNNEMFNINTK